MKSTRAQTALFVSRWKRQRLDDDALRELERQVMDNPLAGKMMRNTGGVRKMRFAPSSSSSGKSGGYRVCHLYFPAHEIVFFLLLFPKSMQANLTADQEEVCRVLSKQIQEELNRA